MHRFVASVLIPCYLAGCVSWKTQEVSPKQALEERPADEARLTLIDGNRIVMEMPRVVGDSLTGVYAGRQMAIPLTAVTEVELPETKGNVSEDTVYRAMTGLFVTAAFLGVVGLVVMSQIVDGG